MLLLATRFLFGLFGQQFSGNSKTTHTLKHVYERERKTVHFHIPTWLQHQLKWKLDFDARAIKPKVFPLLLPNFNFMSAKSCEMFVCVCHSQRVSLWSWWTPKLDYILTEFLRKSCTSELMMLIQCYDRKFPIGHGSWNSRFTLFDYHPINVDSSLFWLLKLLYHFRNPEQNQ